MYTVCGVSCNPQILHHAHPHRYPLALTPPPPHTGDWERLSVLVCPTSSGSGAHDGGGSTGSGKGGTGGSTGGGDPSSGSEAAGPSDDDGEVVAALFSQHNFDALYNCTAGECEFEGLPRSPSRGTSSGGGGEQVVRFGGSTPSPKRQRHTSLPETPTP